MFLCIYEKEQRGFMDVRTIDYYDGDTVLEATVAVEKGNEKIGRAHV